MNVTLADGRARVAFDTFDIESYRTFIRCKTLPEKALAYDARRGVYAISTPERFAQLLDPSLVPPTRVTVPLAAHLFDYQRAIVERALAAKRYAVWADTGLGKTAMFLEFARQVQVTTAGRVLILSPLQIIEQTRDEALRFYGPGYEIERLASRAAVAEFCTSTEGPRVAITNYEKLIEGPMDELRHLAGLILDESSILKTGGGVIKWNLIKSGRGIEYKLSCTATPAPNDTMEYASQAAFLEKLRSEGEILWTYFSRNKRGEWSVKPHAREAFYRFMATWSIYLRDPSHYGWRDILAGLPEPEIIEEQIPLTAEQRTALQKLVAETGAGLFGTEAMGVRERAKMAQLARGFVYEQPGRIVHRVASRKPARVAAIVRDEMAAGRQVLVWTVFDEESVILEELLAGESVAALHGDTPPDERAETVARFRAGDVRTLISKSQLLGYGMNFQNCRAMVFSGFDDSFERMYQAIRRAYRFGQTETVRVHVPYVPELESLMFENVRAKEQRFATEAALQEINYRTALGIEVAA